MFLCSSTVKMENIKREAECCCCFSKEDLFSMLEPHNFEENVEIYSTMIADCFQIQLNSYIEKCNRNLCLICKNCVFRLRDDIMFRCQIQIAYDRLQAECFTKRENQGDFSGDSSNLVNTKCHILKYDNTEGVKREAECCCCFSKEDLFSMLEPHNFEENVEIYSTMIADCFQIELSSYVEECDRNRYLICKNCVFRLRDAIMLRCQIQKAYDRLQVECCTKRDNQDDISSEYSNLVDTKDHILKCDFSEYYNKEDNMNSWVSLLKLKPVKVVLEKMDNKTIKNVSIVFVCDAKSQRSKIYFCNICNRLFRNLYAIQEHEKSHLRISCNICGKTLSSKRTFKSHVLSHSDVKNEKCEMCGKSFTHKEALRNHKKIHLNKNKTCKYCNKSYTKNTDLLTHEKIHLDVKDLICDYCSKEFRHKVSLKEHIMLHMNVKNIPKWTCNICGKTLCSERTFKSHVLSHSGVKSENCEMCGKTFTSKEALRNHKKVHFTKNKTCKYCDKAFTKNRDLSRHEKIHLDIKDLICDYCNKGFRNKNNMMEHILFHMDVRNTKCDLCEKCFVSKKALWRHKRVYHAVRLTCNICDKKFFSKLSFENHALKRPGTNSLKCDVCETTFETQCLLNKHKILHPKTCKYCNKAFKTNYECLRHEKICIKDS